MRGFGAYFPSDSPLHRLHPGVKLGLLFTLVLFLLIYPFYPGLAAAVLLLAGLFPLAKIPRADLQKLIRRAAPLLVLVLAIRIILVPGNREEEALFSFLFVHITPRSAAEGVTGITRLGGLLLLFSLFARITPQRELSYGIEAVTKPLSVLRFPAHEFSLVLIIAFRFLPLIALESERLVRAQTARGADFSALKGGIFSRARAFLPLLIPLFVVTLKRTETMAMALEARCYSGGAGRTRLVRYRTGRIDLTAIAAAAVTITGAIALYIFIQFNGG